MEKKNPRFSKLDLGCGSWHREGWVHIDIDKKWKPDILCDIEKGIPIQDNKIEEIFCKHVLEHISPQKFEFVMQEMRRICKNKAKITIICPYFSCSTTYRTLGHYTPISYYIFDHVSGFKVKEKKLYFFRDSFGYKSKAISWISRIINPMLSFFPNGFPLVYERLFCWTFPMEEIKVVLEVQK